MRLERHTRVPLYHQLRDLLTERIAGGEWKPEEPIPTEEELCREFGVSRGTVRTALASLVAARLISRRPGRGSFVAPPKLEQSLNRFYSFGLSDLRRRGLRATAQVLQARLVPPALPVRRALALTNGKKAIKVVRLRLTGREPLALEELYFVATLFPHLLQEDLSRVPLYDLFTRRYNVHVSKATETLEVTLLDDFEARVLGQRRGAPAMAVERTTYSFDRPFEFRRTVIRADRSKYMVDIFPE